VRKKGKLYGIGLGPGNPNLLTLKAVQVLQEIPVIFVPRSNFRDTGLAHSIIATFLRPEQEIRELFFPMTDNQAKLKKAWQEAVLAVAGVLDEGLNAAFVTIGDSTLYSTYSYLLEELKETRPELEIETIPGISSFSAAASMMNRALVVGEESLAIVPATKNKDFLYQVLSAFDSVILLKVASVLSKILDILDELDRLEDSAFVCRCGFPDQFWKENLSKKEDLPKDYLSLIMVRLPVKRGAKTGEKNLIKGD